MFVVCGVGDLQVIGFVGYGGDWVSQVDIVQLCGDFFDICVVVVFYGVLQWLVENLQQVMVLVEVDESGEWCIKYFVGWVGLDCGSYWQQILFGKGVGIVICCQEIV